MKQYELCIYKSNFGATITKLKYEESILLFVANSSKLECIFQLYLPAVVASSVLPIVPP